MRDESRGEMSEPEKTMYVEWIERRRSVAPRSDLTDRIMSTVGSRQVHRPDNGRLADRVNESIVARYTACAAALLVGIFPFLFVAYVAELIVY